MPRSDWLNVAKIGGLACLGLGAAIFIFWWGVTLGAKSGYYGAQSQGYASQYPSDTDKRIEQCFTNPDLAAAKQCAQEAITADRENQRGERDLQAQREVADWTYYTVIISILQIPLGVLGLIALIVTIRQGQEAIAKATDANEIARENLLTEHRAWLRVEHSLAEDFRKKDTWGTYIETSINNVGNTPALDVYSCVEMHMQHHGLGPKEQLINSLIQHAKIEALSAPRVNVVPGQIFSRKLPVYIDPCLWDKIWRGHFEKPEETRAALPLEFTVFVIAVTIYRTIFEKPGQWRTSAHVYDIRWLEDDSAGRPIPFTDNVTFVGKHRIGLVYATDVAGLID